MYTRKCLYACACSNGCLHTLQHIYTHIHAFTCIYTWIYIYICGEGCCNSGRPGRQISGFCMAHMPHNASTSTAIQHVAHTYYSAGRKKDWHKKEKKTHASALSVGQSRDFSGLLKSGDECPWLATNKNKKTSAQAVPCANVGRFVVVVH